MLFIFSKPVLFRHLWQFETLVLLHGCPISTVIWCCLIMQGAYRYNANTKSTEFKIRFHIVQNRLYNPLINQAFQLGISITFVNTFCFNYLCK